MRFAVLTILAACLVSSAYGQQTSVDPKVLDALRKAAPKAPWDQAMSVSADVMCHGEHDTVVVSSDEKTVWLGVVGGSGAGTLKKPLVQSWPIGHPIGHDAFCAKPVRIDVFPRTCESPDGILPGCQTIKNCQSFSVDDGECDAFNFYWNSRKHSIALWRN